MKQLLGGLLALYVVELVLSATGAPVQLLAWLPLGQGFAPWQPLTRFAVQGPSVLNVLIALAVAWFVFPALDQLLRREQLGEATLAMAAAATVLTCGRGLFSIDELIARRFDAAAAPTPVADAEVATPMTEAVAAR